MDAYVNGLFVQIMGSNLTLLVHSFLGLKQLTNIGPCVVSNGPKDMCFKTVRDP